MIQFHTTNFWNRIASVSKKADTKRAAIAYLTQDLPLGLNSEDTLIVDASEQTIASGGTSAKVLAKLHRRGVNLYHCDALHSKVVVLDGTVFVSSANLSASSQNTLVEAGLETDSPTAVAQAVAFIELLAEHSSPIDENFIARITKIPVTRNWKVNKTGAALKRLKRSRESKTWLVGVMALKDTNDPAELKRIAKGEKTATERLRNRKSELWWIRHSKRSRLSKYGKRGDSIIVMWRDVYSSASPDIVYHHSPVVLNQAEPKHHRIFYEMSPQSAEPLRWSEFKNLAKKVGLPPVSKNAVRELTPEQSTAFHELWEQSRRKRVRH